jgi:hypothetical protein
VRRRDCMLWGIGRHLSSSLPMRLLCRDPTGALGNRLDPDQHSLLAWTPCALLKASAFSCIVCLVEDSIYVPHPQCLSCSSTRGACYSAIGPALITAQDIIDDLEQRRALLVPGFGSVMFECLNNHPTLFPLLWLCPLPLYHACQRARGG